MNTSTLIVHDQAEADAKIPSWLAEPAGERELRLVMRRPIDIRQFLSSPSQFNVLEAAAGRDPWSRPRRVHRVVVAGETGPDARPMHIQWVRDIRDACREAGVLFHFEGWGDWVPYDLDCPPFEAEEVDDKFAWVHPETGHFSFASRRPEGYSGKMLRLGVERSHAKLDGREWPAKEGG